MKNNFFEMVRRAELLDKSTEYEGRMCAILKSLGIDFIRQYPVRTGRKIYFADIYIPKSRLIIEMDGAYHFTSEQKRLDANRSANMRRKYGFHIVRFANGELRNIGKIIKKLEKYL